MFEHFPHSVGVNISALKYQLAHLPRYVTRGGARRRVCRVARAILVARRADLPRAPRRHLVTRSPPKHRR